MRQANAMDGWQALKDERKMREAKVMDGRQALEDRINKREGNFVVDGWRVLKAGDARKEILKRKVEE